MAVYRFVTLVLWRNKSIIDRTFGSLLRPFVHTDTHTHTRVHYVPAHIHTECADTAVSGATVQNTTTGTVRKKVPFGSFSRMP